MTLCPKSVGPANGFSIIEVVVVLSIAALLMTAGLQNFSNTQSRLSFDHEVQSVRRLLVQARNNALTGREEITAKFDFENNSLTLSRGVRGEQKPYNTHNLPAAYRFLSTRDDRSTRTFEEVFFFPDGQTSGASITLASDTDLRRITVDWLGGRVVVDNRQSQP